MQDKAKPRPIPSDAPEPRPGLARHIPLAAILAIALAGALTLHDYLDFATLRDHREVLLAFRDSHFAILAMAFIASYVVVVTFSLPGAAVASVTGGFLFGLAAGTVFNVGAATIGAGLIFLAARTGLGASLSARFAAAEGKAARLRAGLHENEISVLLL
ncbi:MAG: TVP38/TMEM64 family protein, partial [Jhaorihella sp.]